MYFNSNASDFRKKNYTDRLVLRHAAFILLSSNEVKIDLNDKYTILILFSQEKRDEMS